MADFPTLSTDVTGSFVGQTQPGRFNFVFTNNKTGASEEAALPYDQDKVKLLFGAESQTSDAQLFFRTMAPLFEKLQTKDQRDLYDRVIAPNLRAIPANIAGLIPDLAAMATYIPGPDELAVMGYEAITGEDTEFLKKRRAAGKESRKELGKYGVEPQRKRFEKWSRQADAYTKENWGWSPFEHIGTDMTPEARDWFEKVISSAMEFGLSGAAEVKVAIGAAKLIQGAGRIFMDLAKKSVDDLGEAATQPENVKSLIDRANEAYKLTTLRGAGNITGEIAFGSVAALGTESALAALEDQDPKAAGWLKAVVGVGAAFVTPVAARSAVTGLLSLPGVQRVVREGVIDPLFRPLTSAARFTQRQAMGTAPADRRRIASIGEILGDAVERGRDLDQASGLAFTTPELARSEANMLRAKYQDARERLDALSSGAKEANPKAVARIEKFLAKTKQDIKNLGEYANFQESVLTSVSLDPSPGVVNKFFQDEATRLVERREKFFNFIENRFKRAFDDLNFGGRKGGTLQDHRMDYESVKNTGASPVYEETRRRLVMEADPAGIEGAELQFLSPQQQQKVTLEYDNLDKEMRGVLDESRAAAEGRVKLWKDKIDQYLAERGLRSVDDLPDTERAYVGQIIRDTYDDAFREFRAFERAAYGRVTGLDDKVTDNIVFPKGSVDTDAKVDIEGLEVSEWAAQKLETLSRREKFNLRDVPPIIAQLAGSRSVAAAIRRMQKKGGEVASGEAKLETIERLRDDANRRRAEVQSDLDDLASRERVGAEEEIRNLDSYLDNVAATRDPHTDDSWNIRSFAEEEDVWRDLNWGTMTAQEARDHAPKGLANIFNEIRKKKQRILELTGEGGRISKEARPLYNEISSLTEKSEKYTRQIEDITAKYFGDLDEASMDPVGRLTSRDAAGEIVGDGVSADDVRAAVSDVAEAMRLEKGSKGRTPRYRALSQARDTIEQLLSPQTFPSLNPAKLSFAKEVSEVRHRVEAAQGDVLAKDRGLQIKVEQEVIPGTVLAAKAGRQGDVELRSLETAVSEVPDFVTITRNRDPDSGLVTTEAAIDESALRGDGLFEQPDSPFEKIPIGQEGAYEIRRKSDVVASERSLDIAENILLERLALTFPTEIDPRALEGFRQKHKAVLDFLENNDRSVVPKLMNDADGLAEQVSVINNLLSDKTRRKLDQLVNSGQIDLQGVGVDDYMTWIGERRKRVADNVALNDALKAEPGQFVDTLVTRVLSSDTPKKDVQEALSVLRGNKAAEDGFKASFIANFFGRSTTPSPRLQSQVGDIAASVFDPGKFKELLGDLKFRRMITEIFPDNPELLKGLEELGTVAFETGAYTTGPGKGGFAQVKVEDALNMEAWGNLGRILGLGVASRVPFINSLVAAGAGARYLRGVGKNVTGNAIKDIVIEAALNPAQAAKLAQKTADQIDTFGGAIAKGLIDVVNVPGAVVRGVVKRPGASMEILTDPDVEAIDEDLDEEAALVPQAPPARQVAALAPPPPAPARPVAAGSVMSQTSPVGGRLPAQQGAASPDIMNRGRRLFGAVDPVFSLNRGGLLSAKPRKGRQLVG